MENLDSISVQLVCTLVGLRTAFLESYPFSLLIAEQVGLRVSDKPHPALSNPQLPIAISLA